MAKKNMNTNKVISGTHGKVWVGSDKMSNVKSFEAKLQPEYEDVVVSEKLSKGKRYMGYSLAGTMTLHKIDSYIAALVAEGFRSGTLPDVTIVAALEDPAAYGYERVQLTGVKFDELTLLAFETGSLTEESVPFTAEDFAYLDKIV